MVENETNQETSPDEVTVVVPDDDPPVFADSAALARLGRLGDVKIVSYTERHGNQYELIERISRSSSLNCSYMKVVLPKVS